VPQELVCTTAVLHFDRYSGPGIQSGKATRNPRDLNAPERRSIEGRHDGKNTG
jgi:hypothetical protein